MTKSEVLKLAALRWGKTVEISENKRAPTAAERAKMVARRTEIAARIKAIDEELGTIPAGSWDRLLNAARFVVDVAGGEPSMSQLRAAVEEGERFARLMLERREIKQERDGLAIHCYRWRVGLNLRWCWEVKAEADTLEELAATIRNKQVSMKSNQIKRGRSSVVTPAMARKALALCAPDHPKPTTLRALARNWHVSHAAISRAIRRLPAAPVS